MRFKRHLKLEYGLQQIDIAPLINIIFLLFLFFVLILLFTTSSEINVRLPKAVTSDIIKEGTLTITITSENVIYLNNKVVNIKELSENLKNISQANRPLLIKADRRASVGRIVDLWDLCRKLGIEKINIATNQEN